MTLLHDFYGNNAALECIECHKVFVVSALLNKAGRICPHCGKSRGYIKTSDKSAFMHKVPKGETD